MAHERFLIAPDTLMEFAEISATSESTTMPASNLLLPHPADWFVAPSATGLEITVHLDLQAGETWDFVAPLYANFGPNCTWVVSAADTEAKLASPDFQTDPIAGQQSADLAHRSHEWVSPFAWSESSEWQSQGARSNEWVRISVTTVDPKLPRNYTGAPYVQWGRLLIADAWRPPYSVDRGSRQRRNEQPIRSRTLTGGQRISGRRRPRKASYTIGFLERTDSLVFVDELDRRVGESGHVVTIFDPTDLTNAHRETIYGTIESSDRIHVDTDVYRKPITINEAL